MPHRLNRVANVSLFANIFLFIIKIIVGFLSNSIAVISEAINSLTDIISSIAIKYSISLSNQKPDEKHPFGHNAAQPIAAFIVSVFAFVVGIKIIEESIKRIIEPENITDVPAIYIVLLITIFLKTLLNRYQRKIGKLFNSPAIKAAAIDSLNDVLASSIALTGVICASLGLQFFDGIAAIFVAMFILKTGYEIARENLDYLMARSASKEFIIEISNTAHKIEGVKGLNDLRTYHVGNKLHIEIHIEVAKETTTEASHTIGKNVQNTIEAMEGVQKVFVHIDPV